MLFSFDENPHRAQIVSSLGPLAPDANFVPPDLDFLFILFTNRCGSNYLAQVLASTGYFNEAGEFFNGETVIEHAQANNLHSLQEYFCFLPQLVASNGWLVAKLAPANLQVLHEAGILNAIRTRSHFILLERQDRLGQAISREIAFQNLHWTSGHDRLVPQEALVYTRGRIAYELGEIERGNSFLYRFLAANRIAPLHFAYEGLTARPQEHLDAVAEWLGGPVLRFAPARIRLRRQAGAVNHRWRALYLAGH